MSDVYKQGQTGNDKAMSQKRILLFFFILILGGAASLMKSFDLFSEAIVQLEYKVGGDIVLHFAVAIFLGYIACWAGVNKVKVESDVMRHFSDDKRALCSFNQAQVSLIILSIVLVSVDEATQYFISTRTFSVNDWFANMVGLFAGIGIYQLIRIYRMRPKHTV
jgi:hypothetical protein